MKMSVRRWLGASTLALFASFAVAGCSGDQEAEDGIEASDNQAADNGNAVASEDNGGGEKPAGDESNAAPTNAAGGDTAAEAGAAGGNSTENDLQEIITEMNGQQGGDKEAAAGAEGAAPLAGEAPAAAPAPAVASAPAPAAAPAPAPAAAPAPAPAAGGNSATADAKSAALPFQPGGTPAAAGLPELGSKMSYIVEKGDTLAKISQKIYGAPSHWQEMATLSGLSNPSRIFPGDLVYYTLDETAVTFAKAYDSVQRSEEQVKPGDTLATISQRLYGSSESWRTLWRHNDKIENPDVVQPGSTVFYVAKGALQAAIDHVKSGSTTNLATLNAKDSTTNNSPAISAKSLSMSHHKKHHRAHALDASVNLTLSPTNVNVSVNAINAING